MYINPEIYMHGNYSEQLNEVVAELRRLQDVVVHGPDGDCIAWCNGIRVDNEANAKLIAAAPEMLDALRQLSILINAGGNFQLGPKGRHFTLPQSLDKLIAKAEGR